ncbi:MAG TPA: hypothetical protein VFE58_00695 [Tepidisphaeraceae bacterium]|jgi:hypothetical protein|nr:hypothetical protein [Tepidisphaeraceae bacterium]
MVSHNVDKIYQSAKALSEAELQELRRLLDNRESQQPELTKQEQVRHALVERGLVEQQSPLGKDPKRFQLWQPVPIQGKPLSETIIEERR